MTACTQTRSTARPRRWSRPQGGSCGPRWRARHSVAHRTMCHGGGHCFRNSAGPGKQVTAVGMHGGASAPRRFRMAYVSDESRTHLLWEPEVHSSSLGARPAPLRTAILNSGTALASWWSGCPQSGDGRGCQTVDVHQVRRSFRGMDAAGPAEVSSPSPASTCSPLPRTPTPRESRHTGRSFTSPCGRSIRCAIGLGARRPLFESGRPDHLVSSGLAGA